MLLYAFGNRLGNAKLVRVAAVMSVLGVILNRFNVSLIAFNYDKAERYIPRWTEIWISVMIITIGVLIFRWMVNRMPILLKHPDYVNDEH
jgi:Ni/Fe-hydrogenase subunit HybB-like protein